MTEADLTPKAPLVREDEHPQFERTMTVSYTHLTLPTKLEV